MVDKVEFEAGEVKKRAIDRVYELAVFAISALYVSFAFWEIRPTKVEDWVQVIVSFIVSFVMGQSINNLMRMQAISNGRRTASVTGAEELHETVAARMIKCVSELESWCQRLNRENKRDQRMRILAAEGLNYEDFFDEDGGPKVAAINEKLAEFEQATGLARKMMKRKAMRVRRAIERAINIKVSCLTAAALIGSGRSTDPYRIGRDIKTYMSEEAARGAASKVAIAVCATFMGGEFIKNPDYGVAFMYVSQVVVYLVFGFISYKSALGYVTGEYRTRLGLQTELMKRFEDERSGG